MCTDLHANNYIYVRAYRHIHAHIHEIHTLCKPCLRVCLGLSVSRLSLFVFVVSPSRRESSQRIEILWMGFRWAVWFSMDCASLSAYCFTAAAAAFSLEAAAAASAGVEQRHSCLPTPSSFKRNAAIALVHLDRRYAIKWHSVEWLCFRLETMQRRLSVVWLSATINAASLLAFHLLVQPSVNSSMIQVYFRR